jgi:hypothetical protein
VGWEEQAKAKAIFSRFGFAFRSGLRQSGGRLRGGFRREAEASLYLRDNSNDNGNSNDNSRSLRDDKQKDKTTSTAARGLTNV